MAEKKGKNNLITHRIGLYKVAYDLSREGYNVEIDTSATKSGHIVIHKNDKDIYVMVKPLSKLSPVSFTGDFELTNRFDYLVVCVDVYEDSISYYKLDMQQARDEITSNVGKNGNTDYWLDPPKYRNFKVDSLVFE